MMQGVNPKVVESLDRARTDFRTFARNFICIETKMPKQPVLWGRSIPSRPVTAEHWEWNAAQNYIDYAINKMLAELGWVRLIIVKGRQQGCSTYIEMRLIWKWLFETNTKISIISHDQDSAVALFKKAKFAHEKLPDGLRPELQASNRKELESALNGSNYLVLTAGSEDAGRGQTAHHQHQSERASYKDAEAVDAGAGEIVGLEPGTEVYQEYTGKGKNHCFHEVLDALAGRGIFRVIFVPWYWEPGYRSPIKTKDGGGFKRDEDEQKLVERYGKFGLNSDEQLQWRRDKIIKLKSAKKFRQEYPNYLMEAFQSTGDPFYDSDEVEAAMKRPAPKQRYGAVVIGVDAGGDGDEADRTIICCRQGEEVFRYLKFEKMTEPRLAGIICNLIDELNPDKVFIDRAMANGAIQILKDAGHANIVEGVAFGEEPDDGTYLNVRAEMNHRCRDWLKEGGKLPDDMDVAADFGSMPQPEETSSGRLKFPEKKLIKKEYGRSPDILDATVLTFRRKVRSKSSILGEDGVSRQNKAGNVKSELATQRRRQDWEINDGGKLGVTIGDLGEALNGFSSTDTGERQPGGVYGRHRRLQ